MRFFSARLNFDNGIVLKFDGFLVNLFQYKTKACEGLNEQSFTPENLWQSGEKAVLTPPEV